MAYIYLGTKSGKYEDHHTEFGARYKYSVEVSKHLIEHCQSYYYIKYSIHFSIQGYQILTNNFNIVICDGFTTLKKGNIKFEYRTNKHYDIGSVDAYYSILYPSEPLFLSFNTKHFGTIHHSYFRLKSLKQIYGYDLDKSKYQGDLSSFFQKEFRNVVNALLFYTTDGNSTYVKQNPSNSRNYNLIGSKTKFHFIYFTSKGNERSGRLYIDKLLNNSRDKPFKNISIADIPSDKGLVCDGIISYYAIGDDLPLYIKIINGCSVIPYGRKDLDGNFYEENTSYGTEFDLEYLLEYILNNSKNTITYKLNNNVRYSGIIDVKTISKQDYKFDNYKHLPTLGREIKKSSVLYNNQTIITSTGVITSDKISNVQNFAYKQIDTYSLDIAKEFHLLIKLTSTNGNVYYLQRSSKDGKNWKQLRVTSNELKDDKSIRSKLDETIYWWRQSVMVHIDIQQASYDMYLVNNTDTSGREGTNQQRTYPAKTIIVNKENNCSLLKKTRYVMYRHDLSQSKDSSKVKDIGGLRFFVTGLRRDNSSLAYKEVKFYEDVDTKENNRIVVTYTPGPGRANQLSNNDNAYVYFHDNDSRPLLLFYNDRGYKAKDKKDYDNNIWTLDTSIRSGNCEDGGNIYLSNALNNICYYLEIASCREESGTSRPTTTQPGDTHSTISSTPQQKLPPQPPVPHPPRLAPPTLSGQLTTGSSLPPPPEEKSKLPPAKTIQEDRRLTKSLGDQQPRGGHSHTRESRTESESSLPDTTIQMSNRESSSHRDVEMPVQKPESPHGGTRLEEKAQPSEVPKTPVLLPEKTHIQEPTVELPVPDLKEQLHSETNVMVEQRLSIERSPSPIRRKAPEAVSPRSAQHRTEKPQDHSDAPKAEARTDAHDSDSSSESEDQTITIAISGTISVLAVGTVASVLIYFKFPYIIFPAVKAML